MKHSCLQHLLHGSFSAIRREVYRQGEMGQGAEQLLPTSPSFLLGVTQNAIYPLIKGLGIVVKEKKIPNLPAV